MKQIFYAWRSMTSSHGANTIKIVSVAVGLLMSVIVFEQIAYNLSYDTYFRDAENLYYCKFRNVSTNLTYEFDYMPLPLSKIIAEEMTSSSNGIGRYFDSDMNLLYDENGHQYDVHTFYADGAFADVLGLEVISGNYRKDLDMPGNIYLSEEQAQRVYGSTDPVGRTLKHASFGETKSYTVKGVYRDIPGNTTIRPEIIISYRSVGNDESDWSNGSHVILNIPATDTTMVRQFENRINEVYHSYRPDNDDRTSRLILKRLRDDYISGEQVKRVNTILWFLGFALLFITATNYVLITLSSLSARAKSIGVHKCAGADGRSVFGMFLWETVIVLSASALLMVLLVLLFGNFIQDTLSISLGDLFAPSRLWVAGIVIVIFFLIGGLLPARIFARIPVTLVFKRFTERRTLWKPALLFIQFAGVAFIGGMLCVVSMQYNDALNRDQGYSTDRIYYSRMAGNVWEDGVADKIRDTYASLAFVEDAATGSATPVSDSHNGRNITDAVTGRTLYNVYQDFVGYNYARLMGMELAGGRYPEGPGEILINQQVVDSMRWDNGGIGHRLNLSGEQFVVTGVLKGLRYGGFFKDAAPIILQTGGYMPGYNLYVKLREPLSETLPRLIEFSEQQYPGQGFKFNSLDQEVRDLYAPVKAFRNSVLAATIAIVFITLMGLIGYIRDNVQRRSKEIAIRKVNGAQSWSIVELLGGQVMRVAVPAVVIGIAVSWYVGNIWLQQFVVTFDHMVATYILCGMLIITLILLCVVGQSWQVANDNPARRLRSE